VLLFKDYDPTVLPAEEVLISDLIDFVIPTQWDAENASSLDTPGMSYHRSTSLYPHLRQYSEREAAAPKLTTEDKRYYGVWYGTNRRPETQSNQTLSYTSDRDEYIHYGTCRVAIPKTHKFGSIGSNWFKRLLTCSDDRLRIESVIALAEVTWLTRLKSLLSHLQGSERSVLVYVHGFNVSFEEAAIRAAQIGFDLRVPVTAFFSWPSRGDIHHYIADAATIEASEGPIAQWLATLIQLVSADNISIIAHSMGNRGVLRAVTRASIRALFESGGHFSQIFLAAPDVDADLFRELALVYPKISRRATMYVSSRDRALEASYWLHDYPRAGFAPPITIVDGIDTVEVTDIDLTLLGPCPLGKRKEECPLFLAPG
jgi:esterase/lipase superfamily enzyme